MRKLLVFTWCVLFSFISIAQQHIEIAEEIVDKHIRFNINAGFHFSNMIGNVQKDGNIFLGIHTENGSLKYYDTYNLNAGGYRGLLPGYRLGVGITFDKTKYFAWGLDLNFQTKGCLIPMKELVVSYYNTTTYPVYTSNDEVKRFPASNFHSKIRLNYIVIPTRVEFKYKNFYLMPGIYTGFLLNAVNTTQFDYEDRTFNIRHTPTSHYSRIDFGVLLNIGYTYSFSNNTAIKAGLIGEWNVNGVDRLFFMNGGRYSYFCNQVLGVELKYEIKIK